MNTFVCMNKKRSKCFVVYAPDVNEAMTISADTILREWVKEYEIGEWVTIEAALVVGEKTGS